MKQLIPLLLITIWFSAKAQVQSKIEVSKPIIYLEPLFNHTKKTKPAIVYERFEEIATIAIDSVFKKDPKKYAIKGKLDANLSVEEKSAVKSILNQLKRNNKKQLRNIPFPIHFSKRDSLENRYGLIAMITTESAETVYEIAIKKIQLQILLINLRNNEIVFYKKSRNLSNGSYAYHVVKNLNQIYRKITIVE
ncbi:hypothetical protein [Haloflavibacter putidus]|uniref:DUF4252 domain-containing protein n=1 Tax=Haloflavibacter putidus TaxID=2576776 RepID=A0A507ZNM4_9FLAO|nr:hypothetical protein [Haloflavibacter putidus]TQD38889.1 hypothetical protein FKR84_07870 [Haloflavibacter putidus]